MKKIYNISVRMDKWASDYVVEASGWPTAVARGVREWLKNHKGNRYEVMTIKAVKSGPLLQENVDNN